MASDSVRNDGRFILPLDDVNRGGELILQARALLEMMTGRSEPLTAESTSTVGYMLDDMLEEVQQIIERRAGAESAEVAA